MTVYLDRGDDCIDFVFQHLTPVELGNCAVTNKSIKRIIARVSCTVLRTVYLKYFGSKAFERHGSLENTCLKQLYEISTFERMYLFGGYSNSYKEVTCDFKFDERQLFQRVTWRTAMPSMHSARYHFSGGWHGGEIWVCGAGNAYLEDVGTVERCDPLSGIWTRLKTKLPVSLQGAAIISLKGKLLIVGGWYDQRETSTDGYDSDGELELSFLPTMLVLDENKTDISEAAFKPSLIKNIPLVSFGCAEYRGKLYAAGGYNVENGSFSAENLQSGQGIQQDVYSFDDGSWTKLDGQLCRRRLDPLLAVIEEELYAIGGDSDDCISIEKYNPELDKWDQVTELRENRFEGSKAFSGRRIYFFGGGQPGLSMEDKNNTWDYFDVKVGEWASSTIPVEERALPRTEEYSMSSLNGCAMRIPCCGRITW